MMTKSGQSIIEYVLIAVLVVMGIVVMGPFALRSVNAHFKLWDDSVQDSVTENITQAPASSIPTINSKCICENVVSDQCGSATAGSPCPPNELIINHNCNPIGCDDAPTTSCSAPDPNCCKTYSKQGCGTYTCPSSGCPTGPSGTMVNAPANAPLQLLLRLGNLRNRVFNHAHSVRT